MAPYQNFGHPIVLEGDYISTVDDALNFYLSLPMHERIERHWTEAAKLLVSTFEERDDMALMRAERQLRLALAHYVKRSQGVAA